MPCTYYYAYPSHVQTGPVHSIHVHLLSRCNQTMHPVNFFFLTVNSHWFHLFNSDDSTYQLENPNHNNFRNFSAKYYYFSLVQTQENRWKLLQLLSFSAFLVLFTWRTSLTSRRPSWIATDKMDIYPHKSIVGQDNGVPKKRTSGHPKIKVEVDKEKWLFPRNCYSRYTLNVNDISN